MLEELSLNAWPALQSVLYDGWILRFADGYTRRANSVSPLYPSSIDLDQKLRFCEAMYRSQKLNVTFKIASAASHDSFDQKLMSCGYQKDALTSVQGLDLNAVKAPLAREVNLEEDLTDEWLDSIYRLSAVAESQRKTLHRILINIIPRHCFVSLEAHNQIIACGLGVLQGEHIGLFDIVTDSSFRNTGFGRQIVENILAWGKQNGVQTAYLQVMLNNAPALHLYSKIGFVEKYQYWYRTKP